MTYESRVIPGKGRGKKLGFPTLNLEIPGNFKATEGIYACRILIEKTTYAGALHFGPIPVFGDTKRSLEVFVLDWTATEQPKSASFELGAYLRPIQNFPTPEALASQIAADVSRIKSL